MALEVPFADAALGATVDVLTLDGRPRSTAGGHVYRNCGSGARRSGIGRSARASGNQIVTVTSTVPEAPTQRWQSPERTIMRPVG